MRTLPRRRHTPTAEPGVALVAGASRGLGLALTRELVGRGWRVHACSRDLGSLERAAASVSGPGSVVTHRCDVRDAEAVEDLVARVWGEERSPTALPRTSTASSAGSASYSVMVMLCETTSPDDGCTVIVYFCCPLS